MLIRSFLILCFLNFSLVDAKTKINLEIANNRTIDGQLALKNEHHQSIILFDGQEVSIKTRTELVINIKSNQTTGPDRLVEFFFRASIPALEKPIELINTKIIGLIGDSTTFSVIDPRGFNVIFTMQLLEDDPVVLYP
jgi:hypothetical protein